MDTLLVFACIFGSIFVLSMLSAGRDQLLFQERRRTRMALKSAGVLAAVLLLVIVGLPLQWALALALSGPLGSFLGTWVGSGDWMVLRHHVRRRLGSSD